MPGLHVVFLYNLKRQNVFDFTKYHINKQK